MSDSLSDAQKEQVAADLFAGSKIKAIKTYRAATNADLATAKAAVEAMETELRATSPEKFSAVPAKAGCAGVILLLCLIPVAAFAAWTWR